MDSSCNAEMVELVDAPDSKSGSSNRVWVQVPLSAPSKMTYLNIMMHIGVTNLL